MAPACANVEYCNGGVCHFEELISSPLDHTLGAEDSQEEYEEQRNTAKDHVKLADPSSVDFWLRLVKLSFDNCPADGVDDGLHKDDAAAPSVQEVEVLIRNASDEGKNALTGAEKDSDGRESISEGAYTI